MTTERLPADFDWPLTAAPPQTLGSVPASLLMIAEWTGGRTGQTLRRMAERQLAVGETHVSVLDDPAVKTLPRRLQSLVALGRNESSLLPLLRLETDLAQQRRTRWIKGATRLLYPTILLLVSLLALRAVLRNSTDAADMSDSLGVEVPAFVRIFLNLVDYGGWVWGAAAVVALTLLVGLMMTTVPAFRPLRVRLPGFGAVIREFDQAEMLQFAGVLTAGGQTPSTALRQVAPLAEASSTRRRVVDAAARIEEGVPVGEAIEAAGLGSVTLEADPTAAELGNRLEQTGLGLIATALLALEALLAMLSTVLYFAAVCVICVVAFLPLTPVLVFVRLINTLI